MKRVVLVLMGFILLTALPAMAGKGSFRVSITPAPPNLSVEVRFSEPSGNNILDAEETGTLTLTVTNTGRGDAFDVEVKIRANKDIRDLTYKDTLQLGTIPAGTTRKVNIPIEAGEDVPTEEITFTIDVTEANGFDADPVRISFKVREFEPPKLIVADIGIDDQNGNSRVEPMEIVSVTVRVQNIGYGNAKGVTVDIVAGKNVFMAGEGTTHFELGNLGPGEFRDVEFMFYTNKRIKNGEEIPLEVKIGEARPRFNVAKALGFKMNARQRNVRELVVKGIETPRDEIKIATGLSVDIEQDLPRTRMDNKDAIAVVIGNRDYEKTKPVDYALNDARAVKLYLMEVLGFKEGNIFFVENATKGDFELYFGNKDNYRGKLYNAVKEGKSDVFVYYSGHGAPGLKDRKGYFVPVEADPQYIELGGYPLDVFYRNLSRIPAKSLTVVLDACFSGANIFENISPIVLEVENPILSMKNGVVISSSRGRQVSTWYNEKRHGMFTYFFLKAIHNRNADFDKDGRLTFDELYRFISDKTEGVPYYARRLHGVDQIPTIEGQYRGKIFVEY